MHTHAYTYIHIHIRTHTYTYIHIYAYIHIHTHTYTYILIHTHTYTYTYTYIHIHTHTYTYVHMRTYLPTYLRTYIHTYIYTHTSCMYIFLWWAKLVCQPTTLPIKTDSTSRVNIAVSLSLVGKWIVSHKLCLGVFGDIVRSPATDGLKNKVGGASPLAKVGCKPMSVSTAFLFAFLKVTILWLDN